MLEYMDVVDAANAPGYYVSRSGSILSFWRPDGVGRPYRIRKDMPFRTLKPRVHSGGYLRVSLGAGNDTYVHRLVWESFNTEIPEGLQIRHLDGDKTNNSVSNLAVGTASENDADKDLHGTRPLGSSHKNSKLTEERVRSARKLWSDGRSLPEILNELELEVSKGTIHAAIVGKTWRHVATLPKEIAYKRFNSRNDKTPEATPQRG